MIVAPLVLGLSLFLCIGNADLFFVCCSVDLIQVGLFMNEKNGKHGECIAFRWLNSVGLHLSAFSLCIGVPKANFQTIGISIESSYSIVCPYVIVNHGV